MKLLAPLILAENEVHWDKLVPVAIIVAIWALRPIVALFKQNARVTEVQPPPPPMPAPPALPPPLPRIPRLPPTPGPLQRTRRNSLFASEQAAALEQMLARPAAPPAAPAASRVRRLVPDDPKDAPSPMTPMTQVPPIDRVSSPATSRATLAIAALDGRTLAGRMQPANLRTQFILTEILKPPVGLRDSYISRDASSRR